MKISGLLHMTSFRKLCLFFFFPVFWSSAISGQSDTTSTIPQKPWKFDGTFIFNLNESTFTNWVAGGDSQIGTSSLLKPVFVYDNAKWAWNIELDIRHGLHKINSEKSKKSEDVLRMEMRIGRHISDKWKFSALYTINTQERPSWDGDKLISTFMAPCYTNISLGFDYNATKKLNIYMTPLNIRTTYVLNDTLSARGDFGVQPGSRVLYKLGPSFFIKYMNEVTKNIFVDTKFGYFQNVLDGLGDPVINWDAIISMKVNKYIATSFTFALFYDKDSKTDIKDENGNITGSVARLQFKQTFGFGLNVIW
jgi:hypothetical protein